MANAFVGVVKVVRAMLHRATFTFYGALQDFLRTAKRKIPVEYTFTGAPSVKDAIEAIGIPHPEVVVILKNQAAIPFSAPLRHNEHLHVYPAESDSNWPQEYQVTTAPLKPYRFVLDVHLGTLAKALRMLGFDVVYEQNMEDSQIAGIAKHEGRIVLTRDIGLLRHKVIEHGYWLRSQHTREQVKEVISRFDLVDEFRPFNRCLRCNVLLTSVPKEQVLDKLPPKTRAYFHEFYQCTSCSKVYWKGSHYEHMVSVIEEIKNHK